MLVLPETTDSSSIPPPLQEDVLGGVETIDVVDDLPLNLTDGAIIEIEEEENDEDIKILDEYSSSDSDDEIN